MDRDTNLKASVSPLVQPHGLVQVDQVGATEGACEGQWGGQQEVVEAEDGANDAGEDVQAQIPIEAEDLALTAEDEDDEAPLLGPLAKRKTQEVQVEQVR